MSDPNRRPNAVKLVVRVLDVLFDFVFGGIAVVEIIAGVLIVFFQGAWHVASEIRRRQNRSY